jgi:putative ABC transport system substrate-binding protein
MMRRRSLLLGSLALLTAPLASEAQPVAKVYRIAWLHPQPLPPTWVESFRQGLREHGYVEGKDLIIEYRWGDGRFDRLPAMAAELVGLNVDMLISGNTAALRALKAATPTIPIVMFGPGDPLGAGLVPSLRRPGGNITGVSGMYPQLTGKQMELLREIVPQLGRVATLSNPGNPSVVIALQEAREAARALGLSLSSVDVRQADEIEVALARLLEAKPGALVVPPDSMIHTRGGRIAAFAARHRLPSVSPWREYAEAGGLLVYGVSVPDLFRRAVGYVDRILKGAKPGDLPVEQPTKLEVVVNLKTAKTLGLTIPPSVLIRADHVIE